MVWRQMRFQIHDPFPSAPFARHHKRCPLKSTHHRKFEYIKNKPWLGRIMPFGI